MLASWRIAVCLFLLVDIARAADDPAPRQSDDAQPPQSQPAGVGWDHVRPELRDGIVAQANALGQTPDEFLERMFLRHLADKVTETYAAMTDLTVECKVYVSLKMAPPGSQPKVEFDEAAPLVATVLWKMKPNQQFRVEAYDGDRLIWGMVSSDQTKGPNKRSIAVQWTPTVQSKPYEEAYIDDDGQWIGTVGEIQPNLLPGCSVLGMFRLSLVGGSERHPSSLFQIAYRSLMREGIYGGMKSATGGGLCHCVRFDSGDEYTRVYIDPQELRLRQIDDLHALINFMTGAVGGSGSVRYIFRHISNDPLPDSEFEAPDPGKRKIVDMDKLFPH